MWPRDVNDVMHRKRARRIWGIWKKLSSCLRRRRLTFACSPRPWGRCRTWWGGGRWKSQHKKIVPLSPYVEKLLNSKVIKSFVPELRSKYFLCFGISMLSMCVMDIMNVLRTGMNMYISHIYIWVMNIICLFHIFMYGYVTHARREDEANTTSLWSPLRNCYSYNDAL